MNNAAVVHFPRVPLMAALGLVVLVVAGVGAYRLSGAPASPGLADAAVVATRDIRFSHTADGTLEVRDAGTGELLRRTAAGSPGFLPGSMRGLMYARRLESIPLDAPFRLESRSDGQLVLIDTALGARMALNAFGPGNASEFRSLLRKGEDSP